MALLVGLFAFIASFAVIVFNDLPPVPIGQDALAQPLYWWIGTGFILLVIISLIVVSSQMLINWLLVPKKL